MVVLCIDPANRPIDLFRPRGVVLEKDISMEEPNCGPQTQGRLAIISAGFWYFPFANGSFTLLLVFTRISSMAGLSKNIAMRPEAAMTRRSCDAFPFCNVNTRAPSSRFLQYRDWTRTRTDHNTVSMEGCSQQSSTGILSIMMISVSDNPTTAAGGSAETKLRWFPRPQQPRYRAWYS